MPRRKKTYAPIVEKIKDGKVIKTGIFRREIRRQKQTPLAAADLQEWMEFDRTFLAAIRNRCREVLRAAGVEMDADGDPIFRTKTKTSERISRTPIPGDTKTPDTARDAAEVLNDLSGIKSDLLAARIFTAGRAFERMLIREVEPNYLPWRARRGNKDAAMSDGEKQSIADQVDAELSRLKREGKQPKLTSAYRAVAAANGYQDSRQVANVYRALRAKKNRNRR